MLWASPRSEPSRQCGRSTRIGCLALCLFFDNNNLFGFRLITSAIGLGEYTCSVFIDFMGKFDYVINCGD